MVPHHHTLLRMGKSQLSNFWGQVSCSWGGLQAPRDEGTLKSGLDSVPENGARRAGRSGLSRGADAGSGK